MAGGRPGSSDWTIDANGDGRADGAMFRSLEEAASTPRA
jgi:hypothetical protein